MLPLSILSPAEQVASHLRGEIRRGRWGEEMPGAPRLARDLGLDPKTVLAALSLLEKEGLLVGQGVGRRRRILMPAGVLTAKLSIGILLSDPAAKRVDYLGELQHGLVQAGHRAYFVQKTLLELGMDVRRVRRLVEKDPADAWIVVGGGREVLQWFSAQAVPAFALFGRHGGLPIAGARPDKVPAYIAAVDRLAALGHRRISLLARAVRRLPTPGRTERAFLKRMEFHGIATGPYNLPDWRDDREGFQALLDSLFRVTPPTALIVQEAFLFSAAHHFLARNGLRVPDDVSLVCSDADSSFAWCLPAVSHIQWQSDPLLRRILRWAGHIGTGIEDLRQTLTEATFVEGGMIGPAKKDGRR
jgi:DNA-binding LacI/PurR family transcriptional regulator